MNVHSVLVLYLALSACPSFAGETFLTELSSQAIATAPTGKQPSVYSIDTTPTQEQFSGDDCVYITQDQLSAKQSQQKQNDSACYITQFPGQGIETHMQSNEDGEMSMGVKWEFD
ncbi:hypothetical protein [Photobacterium sanguinicancri]|uniref:hypothetical protein n=1 Tax=Photobacterium sanguinicancri TaxID=875932 RepID=UPI0024808164|nr:hypothetical protein [Photobacterium sanguinicancri]